ncbi:MAG: hypothetical protein J6O90_04685, partial [Candidatus Methanomethylophilaceae archaeon]|nr:hypothetical protein [Candidatus Methanomethylophilaceae archaeon]
KGIPLYFSSVVGSSLFGSKGVHRFSRWSSDLDTTIMNVFITDESTDERIEVDCDGMQDKVRPLL